MRAAACVVVVEVGSTQLSMAKLGSRQHCAPRCELIISQSHTLEISAIRDVVEVVKPASVYAKQDQEPMTLSRSASRKGSVNLVVRGLVGSEAEAFSIAVPRRNLDTVA